MRLRSPGRAIASVATVGLALLAGACGGGSGGVSSEPPTPARPSAEVSAALRDPGSSPSAVRTFWRFLSIGALPGALEQYDERVVREVGIGTFAGMLANQQATLASTRLNPLTIENIAGGKLIVVESLPKVGAKTRYSFFLRKRQGEWRIVYDTLSANGLQSFVQQSVQRGIDPSAERPAARSTKAGDDAVQIYRAVALRLLRSEPQARERARSPRRRPRNREATPGGDDATPTPTPG